MAAVFLELDPQGAEEALAAGNEQKRHLTVAFDTPLEVAVDSKGRAPLARIHVPRCRTDYEVLRSIGLAERGQPLRIWVAWWRIIQTEEPCGALTPCTVSVERVEPQELLWDGVAEAQEKQLEQSRPKRPRAKTKKSTAKAGAPLKKAALLEKGTGARGGRKRLRRPTVEKAAGVPASSASVSRRPAGVRRKPPGRRRKLSRATSSGSSNTSSGDSGTSDEKGVGSGSSDSSSDGDDSTEEAEGEEPIEDNADRDPEVDEELEHFRAMLRQGNIDPSLPGAAGPPTSSVQGAAAADFVLI